MTHILLLIDDASIGGGQQHVLWLAERLRHDEFRVSVACEPSGYLVDQLVQRGIDVYALSMSNTPDPSMIVQCVRLLRQLRPDLIHTHGGTAGFVGRVSALFAGVRHRVHTYHGIHYLHGPRTFAMWMYRTVDRVLARITSTLICVAEADYRLGLSAGVVLPAKTVIIHNGIDFARFQGGSVLLRDRERVVGTVGRLHRQKGHIDFIEAACIVTRRHPEVRFEIVGEGELRGELERLIVQRQLQDRFLLRGALTDIPEVLVGLDVFVLPSLWEGLSLVLLEAMATGVPIVASDIEGNAELVEDRLHGLLVPPRNPELLAGAICTILEDREFAKQLAHNAFEKVRKEYDIQSMIEKTEAVYRQAMGES